MALPARLHIGTPVLFWPAWAFSSYANSSLLLLLLRFLFRFLLLHRLQPSPAFLDPLLHSGPISFTPTTAKAPTMQHLKFCPFLPARTFSSVHARRRARGLGAALLSACLALALLGVCGTASGAERKKPHRSDRSASTTAAAGPQAKPKGSVKIKHQRSPSEESTAERDRRLYRECRGRPNAGACLGYTQR